jgi:regulator of sirC expression with transglutaminase-like and TPR domain
MEPEKHDGVTNRLKTNSKRLRGIQSVIKHRKYDWAVIKHMNVKERVVYTLKYALKKSWSIQKALEHVDLIIQNNPDRINNWEDGRAQLYRQMSDMSDLSLLSDLAFILIDDPSVREAYVRQCLQGLSASKEDGDVLNIKKELAAIRKLLEETK